jgi:lipopolysaccharide/colanic/teichoic acid biosynthesis glycosyltransferase
MQRFTLQHPASGQERSSDVFIVPSLGNDSFFYHCCKRFLDIFLILLVAPPLFPLLLLIGLLIKLDSPGPVLFVQPRVGTRRVFHNGRIERVIRIFPLYKFRSMYHNVDGQTNQ